LVHIRSPVSGMRAATLCRVDRWHLYSFSGTMYKRNQRTSTVLREVHLTDEREKRESGSSPFPGFDPKSVESYVVKDPHELAVNLARALEHLGQAASEWLGRREDGEVADSA